MRNSRLFLGVIGLVTLVILILNILSLSHQRDTLQRLADVRADGERLVTDIERRSWDMAASCLEDPNIRTISANVPVDPAAWGPFHTKIREALRKHPIADNVYLSVDGNLVFPRLESKRYYSAVDSIVSSKSPADQHFAALFRNAEEKWADHSYEMAIPIFERCAQLPVSYSLRAQAFEHIARCYESAKKPTQAVRTWHLLEDRFGDYPSESFLPYALLAPFELDRLAGHVRGVPDSLDSLYSDLLRGRWCLSADLFFDLKKRLERRIGSGNPFHSETPYVRQMKLGPLIKDRLREDASANTYRVYGSSVYANNRGTQIYYMVLPERSHRSILAISVDSDWVAGPLLEQCRAWSGINTLNSFQITTRPSAEKSEIEIPFITVFPFLQLSLPEGASAAGVLEAKIQLWLITGSGILMIGFLAIVSCLLIRISREQMMIQARSDFLGHISHELKTPLTLILLYAETLADKTLSDEEHTTCVQIISREGERLKHLIENLLQLSKIERAKIDYRMQEGDLGSVIEKTSRVCADWLQQQGIKVTLQISPNLPPVIFDSERVAQLVINLVENARKYGSSNPIEIRLWGKGSSVILEVEDHGIGIPESEHTRIFEQYYRASNAEAQRGSGLGLFLVSETMKAHNGEIQLTSEVGKGSCFRMIFPAAAISRGSQGIPAFEIPSSRADKQDLAV